MVAPLNVVRVKVHLLETGDLFRNCPFGGKALDARSAKEPGDTRNPTENILNILGLRNWASVTKNQNFRADRNSRFVDRLNTRNRLIQSDGCLCAYRTFRSQPHMRN